MRARGFRFWLPLLNSGLYLYLVWVAPDLHVGGLQSPVYPAAYLQEGGSVPWDWQHDAPVPRSHRVALALNAPAVLLTLPLLIFASSSSLQPHSSFAVVFLAVPWVWYWVGLWLDRRLGWTTAPVPRNGAPWMWARYCLTALTLALLTAALIDLARLLVAGSVGEQQFLSSLLVSAWCLFAVVITLSAVGRALRYKSRAVLS